VPKEEPCSTAGQFPIAALKMRRLKQRTVLDCSWWDQLSVSKFGASAVFPYRGQTTISALFPGEEPTGVEAIKY